MTKDSKEAESNLCTTPRIVCSVFSPNGEHIKFECSELSGKNLNKSNFDIVIDWLNKEKEKYPDVFS